MSVLTQVLGNSAEPHQIVYQDRTYRASLIDDKVMAAFEKRHFARAREASIVFKDTLSAEEFYKYLGTLNDDYMTGGYSLLSPRGQKYLKTPQGSLLVSALIFGCTEAEILRLFLAKKEEMLALVQLVVRESFPDKGIEVGEPGEENQGAGGAVPNS